LFGSWVLEGRGGEGKAYGELNPCMRVLKKHGKVLGRDVNGYPWKGLI
jgi:hypothetical protein